MNHYKQIVTLYNSTKKLWDTLNARRDLTTPGYNALVAIERNGRKLMWTAYRFGISAENSAQFRNTIERGADDFASNVYQNLEVSQAAAGPMRELRTALTNYIPQNVKAVFKPKEDQV